MATGQYVLADLSCRQPKLPTSLQLNSKWMTRLRFNRFNQFAWLVLTKHFVWFSMLRQSLNLVIRRLVSRSRLGGLIPSSNIFIVLKSNVPHLSQPLMTFYVDRTAIDVDTTFKKFLKDKSNSADKFYFFEFLRKFINPAAQFNKISIL